MGTDFTYQQTLWHWITLDSLQIDFGLYLDGLSVVMMSVVTGVGFLIHWYSAGYMEGDESYQRFFCYMNLFVAAMLILVLGDSLIFLYLGWEGVGLCSYFLIGFWHQNKENVIAARKAFVVTRVGDTAMIIGLFLLFLQLGDLNIANIVTNASSTFEPGSLLVAICCLLLLGGAVGKSAQLPLQTWLPDAMAGPTPVSALIHAATMVTAGVYLIARMHPLFLMSPQVMHVVAVVGMLTLLIAGATALFQSDIKRILAFSTISQIGYMFLGLGVGAWSASVFHLVTHAFFKALLFMAAGAVILAMHHEQNIFKMGGLRKKLPLEFWSFLIGSAALSALPFTSGFMSKEMILAATWFETDAPYLWWGGLLGAVFTGAYSFRLIFIVFFGPSTNTSVEPISFLMKPALLILCVLSLVGGYFVLPLDGVFETAIASSDEPHHLPVAMEIIAIAAPFVGLLTAAQLYLFRRGTSINQDKEQGRSNAMQEFFFSGWKFDQLYENLIVKPFGWSARVNKNDVIDDIYVGIMNVSRGLHHVLTVLQTGYIRWYVACLTAGTTVLLVLVLSGH